MDPINITLLTIGTASCIGLAWLSGYNNGQRSARPAAANLSVSGLLAAENARRPKAAKIRRKATRKAVRA